MENRKAFNFYRSYYDVVNELPDEDKLAFLMALLDKQFNDVEPELTGTAKFAYISQRHNINSQVEGYKHKSGKHTPSVPPTEGPSIPPTEGPTQPPSHPFNAYALTTIPPSVPPSLPPSVQEKEKEQGKEEVKVYTSTSKEKLPSEDDLDKILEKLTN
jgi:hypothetical protein